MKYLMNKKNVEEFCGLWLPAWTGNNPEKLLTFYDRNAYYSDPTIPKGLKGHDKILPYLRKLLENNPNWRWTPEEIFPGEKGFTLKWKAVIPVRNTEVIEYGMDIVELINDKITRNEVYFDTLKLITAIRNR
jgi:hypothetical protein